MFSVFVIVSCKKQVKESEIKKPHIVTTTGMIADTVKNIVGDTATVEAIMGSGVDPHLYKASPSDIRKLQSATLVVFNGLHLEGKMGDILEKITENGDAYNYASGITNKRTLLNKDGAEDPHIWMDVALWSEGIDELRKKLEYATKADLKDNAGVYKERLSLLHKFCKESMDKIPLERRVLITAHDAFGYFGSAYGVEVKGIQGLSTESEAGLKEINNLVELITKRRVKAVFVESSVSPKNIQALIEGAKHRGADVSLGGELYSDAMGDAGTDEGTYIGMIQSNVNTILEALK